MVRTLVTGTFAVSGAASDVRGEAGAAVVVGVFPAAGFVGLTTASAGWSATVVYQLQGPHYKCQIVTYMVDHTRL